MNKKYKYISIWHGNCSIIGQNHLTPVKEMPDNIKNSILLSQGGKIMLVKKDPLNLTGKVAVITGGSSGIGLGVV